MKTCAFLIAGAVALACAHEDKGVARNSSTKTQASSSPAEAQATSTADTSKTSRAAATSQEGTIPLSASPQAAELLRRGYDALFTTNIDIAQEFWRKSLEQEPTFLAAQAFLYDFIPGSEAMRKVEEATKAGARLPDAERTLLEVLNADKHGDLKTAVDKAGRLVELAPNDPISHIALAQGLLQGHKLDEALAEFHKASDLDPRLGAPYVQMAFIHDVRGNRDEEVAVLRKWVAARPDDSAAQSGLAGGLAAAGKLDEAADAARKATTMANAGYNT
jgi:tetratricopeptide (TPR) repeat protein